MYAGAHTYCIVFDPAQVLLLRKGKDMPVLCLTWAKVVGFNE